MDVQQCVMKVQIIWNWGSNLMRLGVRYLCVKYWGIDVKGEESEINSDSRNSFMEAFSSFPLPVLWARFRVRHE